MRRMTLIIAVVLVGWTAATVVSMTQTPTIAISAQDPCAAAAKDWSETLSAGGFRVVLEAPKGESDVCLTGRAGGFDLEGAVPPDAVAKLLKKRPKGLHGLSVIDAPDGEVLALNLDGSRSTFMDAEGNL